MGTISAQFFYDEWGQPVVPNRATRRAGERGDNRPPRRASRPWPISRNAYPCAVLAKSIAGRDLAILVESLALQAEPEKKRDIALRESEKSDLRPPLDRLPPDPIPAADPGVNLTPRVVPAPRA